MISLKCNCCDGKYNSFDIHFTSACDNKCKHCIDNKYAGLGITRPDVKAITDTIIQNANGYDDVLFLGGEPCLFLSELLECVAILREKTKLKLYVTTSVPKVCYDQKEQFFELIHKLDGINLSVQSHNEEVADTIRCVKSRYPRQEFYASLPEKDKIRINLNIVKPHLYTKEDIIACLSHYNRMGYRDIKLSEIQHGKEFFVSFEDIFGIKLPSPYSHGCQSVVDMRSWIPDWDGTLLLKRSCFLCEETLKASTSDLVKSICKCFIKQDNKYAVIYENGQLSKGWI